MNRCLQSVKLDQLVLPEVLATYLQGVQVGRIVASLERYGYKQDAAPIIVGQGNVVLSGRCRVRALRFLCLTDPATFHRVLPSRRVAIVKYTLS